MRFIMLLKSFLKCQVKEGGTSHIFIDTAVIPLFRILFSPSELTPLCQIIYNLWRGARYIKRNPVRANLAE
ncbi:hypothetical protein M1N53_03810, partial [Thermodesulfovibrionales bacterium]|nr:hypothetical protein [Thermodesulfovibrionales bacterium]